MERVVVFDIMNYLRHHGIIYKQQHGFLSGRSTTSNLLETFNDWTLALVDKNSVPVANIDSLKLLILYVTVNCNVNSSFMEYQAVYWICSFVNGRTQQTRGHG